MKFRLAGEPVIDSIVDGPGLRTTIFFQGCKWNCKGCHNPGTHDMMGGMEADTDEIVAVCLQQKLQNGVTLSGGDPFFQPEALLDIVKKLKEHDINIWCYTGFLFENLIKNDLYKEILQYIDVLVDGQFELQHRKLSCLFKGSTNQRLIDVHKSIEGNITLYE